MKCFRAIVAILMLVAAMPLANARASISPAAAAQRDCCQQKASACCEGPAKACCATKVPADSPLFASQDGSQLVLLPAVGVVPIDHRVGLEVRRATRRLPAEHSPPGLLIVATTNLRI